MNSFAVIIADDLTGANDSGVQFARLGWRTRVQLSAAEQPPEPTGNGAEVQLKSIVTVINAGTRSLPMNEAKEKTASLASAVHQENRVFKKLDSTMRGNIGAEVEAMMAAGGFELAVIAPAYPLKGRTTIGGYHLLHGKPLEDTDMAHDPSHPAKRSKLTDIIGAQTDWPVAHMELSVIRSGRLTEALEQQLRAGVRLFTFDAASDGDLDAVCQAAGELRRNVLWAGSAGLAGALARQWSCHEEGNGREREDRSSKESVDAKVFSTTPSASGPASVLVISGSASPVTARQISTLKRSGVEIFTLDPAPLLRQGECYAETEEGQKLLAGAGELLSRSKTLAVVLDVSSDKREETKQIAGELGLSQADAGPRIAEALGAWGAALVRSSEPHGLVLTGGDTAYGVCRRIGTDTLEIIGEVEEGLPVSMTNVQVCKAIVTKAGAFGNDESLLQAVRKLNHYSK